jgi:cytochrome b561
MEDRMTYTRTAITLHWLVALLVFVGWGLGIYMHDLPTSPAKLQYYSWHKWLGVTVFLLTVARVGWRLTHHAPPLPATVAPWQVTAARLSHFMLYVLLLAVPLSGWTMSSAKGFQTVWFGVLPLPDLLVKDEALGKLLAEVHELLAYTLAGVVALHFAAALRHHFVDRDVVLRRMLPVLLAALFVGAAASGNVATARSELTATFRQMGVRVEGRFTSFRGNVQFDPAQPAGAKARLEVDTASLDLGGEEYNDEVRGKEWLDSKAHPRAVFVSAKVTPDGADRLVAEGTLTLKGKAQPLSLPVTYETIDGARTYAGQFTLSRKAFGIGDPAWEGTLDDAVVVRFRLVTPAR